MCHSEPPLVKAGMAVVPLNVRLHPEEHEYMVSDSGAFALVYGEEFRDHLAQVRANLTGVKQAILDRAFRGKL